MEDFERFIYQEVIVNASVPEVWQAWTTKQGLEKFFPPRADIELRPGGKFEMLFLLNDPVGLQGSEDMHILGVQPEHMLSFTWNFPPHLTKIRSQMTSVVIRFKALDDGRTRVRLFQSGWGDEDGEGGAEWEEGYNYFNDAWRNVLTNLEELFA